MNDQNDKYIVHINYLRKYTSIHHLSCSFTRKPRTITKNTEWFGTYNSINEAIKKTNGTKYEN